MSAFPHTYPEGFPLAIVTYLSMDLLSLGAPSLGPPAKGEGLQLPPVPISCITARNVCQAGEGVVQARELSPCLNDSCHRETECLKLTSKNSVFFNGWYSISPPDIGRKLARQRETPWQTEEAKWWPFCRQERNKITSISKKLFLFSLKIF